MIHLRSPVLRASGLLLVAVWIGACQSVGTATVASSNGGAPGGDRCEGDYERYASSRQMTALGQKTRSIAGTTVSYAAAGSVAVTETLLYTTGGIALGALICTPLIAIEVAADSNGQASIECVARVGSYAMVAIAEESDYSLTRGVWRATESMRLESYDDLAAYLLDSVECRIRRGEPGDLEQARRQLSALRHEGGIWVHLSAASQDRAERLRREVVDQTSGAGHRPAAGF